MTVFVLLIPSQNEAAKKASEGPIDKAVLLSVKPAIKKTIRNTVKELVKKKFLSKAMGSNINKQVAKLLTIKGLVDFTKSQLDYDFCASRFVDGYGMYRKRSVDDEVKTKMILYVDEYKSKIQQDSIQ
jgi:hypothetical protein